MFGLNKLSSIPRDKQDRCGLPVQSHWVNKVQVYVSFLENAPSCIYFPVLFTVWRWNLYVLPVSFMHMTLSW